jgi:hypothetical protein
MATACTVSVTKNADGSYLIVSGDQTNAKGWFVTAAAANLVDDSSSVKNKVWQEIKRQIEQI